MNQKSLIPLFYLGAITLEQQFAEIAFDISRSGRSINTTLQSEAELLQSKQESIQSIPKLNSQIDPLLIQPYTTFNSLHRLQSLHNICHNEYFYLVYPIIIPAALALPAPTTILLQMTLIGQTLILTNDMIKYSQKKDLNKKRKEQFQFFFQTAIGIGAVVVGCTLVKRGISQLIKRIRTLREEAATELQVSEKINDVKITKN